MQYCIENIKIYAGEKRSITVLVHSKKNEEFVIRNAEIMVKRHGNVIEKPTATVKGHEICFTIDSSSYQITKYEVVIAYTIADEKMIAKFTLEVM